MFDICNRYDVVIVMVNLNVKVGEDNKDLEGIMEKYGLGNINDNGEWLCDFCLMNGFVIIGICFLYWIIYKVIWVLFNGRM